MLLVPNTALTVDKEVDVLSVEVDEPSFSVNDKGDSGNIVTIDVVESDVIDTVEPCSG